MNKDKLERIGKLLKLIETDREWNEPKDVISKHIYDWVADWTKEMKSSRPLFTKAIDEKHKELNDKLVEHGFLDLAREIMTIEQQLT